MNNNCQPPEMKKRRVTFKKQNGNQAIREVLLAIYSVVVKKDKVIAKRIELALASLSKYPLELTSGADCLILQGFNKNLCEMIDEKLFKKNNGIISSPPMLLPESPTHATEIYTKDIKMAKNLDQRPANGPNKLNSKINIDNQLMCDANLRCSLKIDPILIALNQQALEFPDRPTLNLKELMLKAQSYCSKPITDWRFLKLTEQRQRYIKTEIQNGIPLHSLAPEGRRMLTSFLNGEGADMSVSDLDPSICVIQDDESLCYHDKVRVPSYHKCTQPTPTLLADLNRVQNDYPSFIDLPPDSYDIVMLIDKNEPEMLSHVTNTNIKCETRCLKVGDVLWIARSKINSQELVLSHIIERKRMDDLAASIKDGRFHEQKFRLRKCGLSNVVYLIEDHQRNKHCGLPMSTLNQAIANTRVQDGFLVQQSFSLNDTKRFLNTMSMGLASEVKGVHLRGSNTDSGGRELMTFEYFSASSSKTKPLTIKNLLIKMLLQLKGLSVEKALAITKHYDSPRALLEAYDQCAPREAELLLANLKFNGMSPRVSPALSKIICKLFNNEYLQV